MLDNTASHDEIFIPPFMHTALRLTLKVNYRTGWGGTGSRLFVHDLPKTLSAKPCLKSVGINSCKAVEILIGLVHNFSNSHCHFLIIDLARLLDVHSIRSA